MSTEPDDETWLIEAGDAVIQKKSEFPELGLSALERLIYCLWVADYGMRNAGDLEAATDLYGSFQAEGLQAAGELGLPFTRDAFSLSRAQLAEQYFHLFPGICAEVRNA